MKNLKQNFIFGLFVALMLVLTGCPYSSTVPISQPNTPFPKEILGKWVASSQVSKDKPTTYYEITEKNPKVFVVTTYDLNRTDKTYKKGPVYNGHLSEINGVTFINLFDVSQKKYLFYKLNNLSQEKFTLQEITDNITENFTSSAELQNFIKKYMNLSFFYNKTKTSYIKRNDL